MQTIAKLVAAKRDALEKRAEDVRGEAQGMIRAIRRKLEDLEGRLNRKTGKYTEADAGVEEALTLAFRLSRLVSLELQAAAAHELEKVAEEAEARIPLVALDPPKEPGAAEIPGMDEEEEEVETSGEDEPPKTKRKGS